MGIYDLMRGIQQQGEEGRQRGLAQLVGKAYAAPQEQRQSILNTVAQRGAPDMAMQAQQGFSKMDETSAADLAREAGMFVALAQSGDEPTIQAAYQQLARKAQQAGHPVPLQYNPSFLPGIEKLASAGGAVGGNVQSTYIDAQGNRVAIMRDGSTQVLGQNAPSNQIIDTGNGFFGVNKGNLQAAPVTIGGQAPQQPPQSYAPAPEITMQTLPGVDVPPGDEVAMLAAAQNEGQAYVPQANGGALPQGAPMGGQQLRSAPKPEAPPAGYRYVGDQLQAIPGGPADPAIQAQGNDNGRNYVVTTGPDGTIYRVNKLTGKADAVEGARGGGASLANLDYKKDSLGVQKGTGANQIERGLQRLETAVNTLSKNKVFDGGPLDQYVLGPTKLGQEMEQAGGSIMPALTALTRVPGVGSQSDWEGRLNMLQLPSVKFSPEVNKRAIAGLRQFITDLREAYRNVGIPFPMDANQGGDQPRGNSVTAQSGGATDPLGIL